MEKEQLIENIILSEIAYARNKRLGNTSAVTADENIVRTWMTNFNITNKNIRDARNRVLLQKKQDVEAFCNDSLEKTEEGGALAIADKEREVRDKIEKVNKDNTLSQAEKIAKKLLLKAELQARKKEIKNVADNVYKEKVDMLAEVDDLLSKPFSF